MMIDSYLDGLVEWYDQFYRTALALPPGSAPRAVRCRSCGEALHGIAGCDDAIATQRFQPMDDIEDEITSFWFEAIGSPVLHQGRAFRWRCLRCNSDVKLVPPQKMN